MADGKKAFSWDDFDKQQSSGGKKPFLWDDEADQNPELLKTAPHTTPVRRLDEVKAAREPKLTWKELQSA